MWRGGRRIYLGDARFIASGVPEEDRNDDEGNKGVSNFNWDVVAHLLRELFILLAVEEDRPHQQKEGEDTYDCSSYPCPVPERARGVIDTRGTLGESQARDTLVGAGCEQQSARRNY